MKATLLTSALAICAITAVAADTQPQAPPPEPTHPVSQQTLSAPAKNQQQDSPLVAAAKRAGRLGKKPTSVITNDTLLKTGGHFTTTQSQEPLPSTKTTGQAGASDAPITTNNAPAPATAPAVDTAKKTADEKAAKTAKAAARRAGADAYGESIENVSEDPAAQEGAMRQTTPGPAAAPKPVSAPAPPRPPSE